ncbi:MAG TPA: serine/threonine-protein kinase [Polyangiaceae bacterium]|nr:serine/threonine-protein kinase [Polyangiaceae bacterium]
MAPAQDTSVPTDAAPSAEPPHRVLGGSYEILRELDSGAMGVVYEAEHRRLRRHVAVKVLARGLAERPDVLQRFRREADVMSCLEHPHIVTILDFDVTELGEPYLVLELLHGETLTARLEREAPLGLEEARDIVLQVGSALAAAHEASIVHRDLKPSNIFLVGKPTEAPFVKLLDFGISKHLGSGPHVTQVGTLVGTPEYMAPEQAAAKNELVDARTDQYALALVAYEMLTGTQPYAEGDLADILGKIATLEAPPASSLSPWVPEEVDAVLARALKKDPRQRFKDVREFTRRFAEAISPWASRAPSESSPAPVSRVRDRAAAGGREIQARLEAVHRSLEADRPAEAAEHARSVLQLASQTDELEVHRLAEDAEPLLARALLASLGSPGSVVAPVSDPGTGARPSSSRAAFLLSRIDAPMTVSEILDVGWLSHIETLLCLSQLVAAGALRVGPPPGSSPAAAAPPASGWAHT